MLTRSTRSNFAGTHIAFSKRVKLAYVLQSHLSTLETDLTAMTDATGSNTIASHSPSRNNDWSYDGGQKTFSAGNPHTNGSALSATLAVLTYQRTSHILRKPSIFH